MQTLNVLIYATSAVMYIYSAQADEGSSNEEFVYEVDKLEQMYLDLHPDIKNITWREAENLTPETHKNVCDQVLHQIEKDTNITQNYTFLAVPRHRIQSERVMKDPLLILDSDVAHPTIIQCFYDEKRFYIAKADDNHVFRLRLSRGTHVFDFESGLHPVRYN